MDKVRCDADLLLRAYFTAANLPVWKASAIRDIVNAGSCQHCGGVQAESIDVERLIQLLQQHLESLGDGGDGVSVPSESAAEASGPWAQTT